MKQEMTTEELSKAGAIQKIRYNDYDGIDGEAVILNTLGDPVAEEVGIYIFKENDTINRLYETITIDEKNVGFGSLVCLGVSTKMTVVGCGKGHNKVYGFDDSTGNRRAFMLELPERFKNTPDCPISHFGVHLEISGYNLIKIYDEHRNGYLFLRSNRYFDWQFGGRSAS